MATEDARYRQSTQFRLWSFSPSQLADLRSKTNCLAKASISSRLSASSSAATSAANTPNPSDGNALPGSQPQQAGDGAASQLPEFLTPSEEAELLKMYTVELLRAAEFCELPTDIRATAAVFLRRFYVTNSIMTYPPTEMLKTAMFFGAKAEGFYTRLSKFADNFPNTTPEEILAGEFLLCQGVRFAFDVRHPFRSLEGAIMEVRRYGDVDDKRLAATHSRARDILKFSPLVTDAYFHYTPSQIMLASLALADEGIFDRIMRETFPHQTPAADGNGTSAPAAAESANGGAVSQPKKKTRRENISGAEVRAKVVASIESCKEMLRAEPPERMSEFWGKPEANRIVRPLVKKLKKCRDPDRWDLVALQNARREQALNAKNRGSAGADDDGTVFGGNGSGTAEELRDPKRRKVSRATEDPFGPAL